ncbi:hypothetical protein CPB84DRAFT_1856600 [Gymnopilus junonius]|uniref:Uncharacterized protein n=1 Tax=Gymnopilus junonius TaxID=109634 RepID=A0A9P5N7A9_GYMJU|nr:hypothetical protein CPB84DRAFT_1856600 [Gymnopilus junonius]
MGSSLYEIGTEPTGSDVVNAIITSLIFQNTVPISLYISIEIVRTNQAYFISQDVEMYYEPYDTACVPKTWNISDDLSQIEYVFSDKTGTLTQNIKELQKCSMCGMAYREGITKVQCGAARREGGLEDPQKLELKFAENLTVAFFCAFSAAQDVGFPFLGKMKDTLGIERGAERARWAELFIEDAIRAFAVQDRLEGPRSTAEGADSLRMLCISATTNAVENQGELIDKANALIEHSLEILGETALGDKLEEGVPEAITRHW